MKVFIVAFLALAVGSSALPQEYELEDRALQRNAIERQIRRLIEVLSEAMRANGLDPFQINRLRIENSPTPGVDIDLSIEDLTLLGASNIQIERLTWNTVGSRLRMTIVLPNIFFFTRKSSISVNYHGDKYTAEGSGEFLMQRLVVSVDIRVNVGIISGITIRSVDASLRIGSLWCEAELVINEEDYSDIVNTLVNEKIPRFMVEHQNTIDLVLGEAIKWIGNTLLENRVVQSFKNI